MSYPQAPWIKDDPIYSILWNRLQNENRNFLGVYCGQTGSGKSWAALSTANALDIHPATYESRFNIDHVVFSADDFLDLVRKGMPKGSYIVWDEVGVGLNARLFYEKRNLAISYITQTFRFKNLGVIYTVPSFSYVDKQVRLLFHAYIKVLRPQPHYNRSIAKWYWIDYDPKTSMMFYPMPRAVNDGIVSKYTSVTFPKAPKELIAAYEEKKETFVDELFRKQGEILNNVTQKKTIVANELLPYIEEINKDPEKFIITKHLRDKSISKRFSRSFIAEKLNIPTHISDKVAAYLNNKKKQELAIGY